MGRRGGTIGGSSNTSDQFRAIQTVGLTYGRTTGLGNQGSVLSEFIRNFSIWAYSATAAREKRGADRSDELFFLVSAKEAFVDIIRTLNIFVPNSIPIGSSSTMHKLVYQQRPQMYGWRIVNMLTRSEIREGIYDKNFFKINLQQFFSMKKI